MPKLTDTQLVLLSAAARRDDGAALPPPKSLKVKGGALTTVLKSLLKKGLLEETPAKPDAAVWREAEDGRRLMLILTTAGLQVIGGGSAGPSGSATPKANPQPKKATRRTSPRKTPPAQEMPSKTASPAARPGSKQALLVGLLERKTGASLDEIVDATGWQPHSVRGAISGTLKKKLGLTVASEKVGNRGRVYRIVAER